MKINYIIKRIPQTLKMRQTKKGLHSKKIKKIKKVLFLTFLMKKNENFSN